MTKKDYILIANILKKYALAMSTIDYKVTGYELVDEIILTFCEQLKMTNTRFDDEKFLTACHFREWQLKK